MALQAHKFKIIMIGDDVTLGKSSLLMRLVTGELKSKRIDTPEVEEHHLVFHTSLERLVEFSCLDTGDKGRFLTPRDGVFDGAHGVIAMFSPDSRTSMNRVVDDCRTLCKCAPGCLVALCGDTSGLSSMTPRVKPLLPSIRKQVNTPKVEYFEIGSKKSINLEKPFLWLARKLVGDLSLTFVEKTIKPPPSIESSERRIIFEGEVALFRFTKDHKEVLDRGTIRLRVLSFADGRLWFVGHNVSSGLCYLNAVFVRISPPCIYEDFNRICPRHIACKNENTVIVHLEDCSSYKITRDFPLHFNISFDAEDFFNVVSAQEIGDEDEEMQEVEEGNYGRDEVPDDDQGDTKDDGMYQTRQWPMTHVIVRPFARKS